MSEPALTLLYDGLCPICSREMRHLARRARRRGVSLGFQDITRCDFDPARHGLTAGQVHRRIHAIGADGRVIEGMEVFRRAYRAVGLGWLVAWTGWPVLRPVANAAYALFARIRPRFSRQQARETGACALGPP